MNPNDEYELNYAVRSSDSAKALSTDPQDDFPEVFATSRMIAVMELAAARLMKPLLSEGELSVGVVVDIQHLGATVVGSEVTVKAVFRKMSGKLFVFDVTLTDGGHIVGKGSHSRAIVQASRLINEAKKRPKTGN